MKQDREQRGGAPVGLISDLSGVEAASVLYLRLWNDGPQSQANVWHDFASCLGREKGRKALKSFEDLCGLFAFHGRRPLMRHSVHCKCLGADEACFGNFICTAALGDRDDAMLIATLMVRPDFALALKRMNLCTPKQMVDDTPPYQSQPTTLH
ncbi:hypothetical protein [Aestuariibius sp. HNIBRBA575]|uniref:hypothetical protein n=1 Tax=Aestuariibius sp. HNIBRBA575 TaxID=3233343 RepID=UPI0034A3F419